MTIGNILMRILTSVMMVALWWFASAICLGVIALGFGVFAIMTVPLIYEFVRTPWGAFYGYLLQTILFGGTILLVWLQCRRVPSGIAGTMIIRWGIALEVGLGFTCIMLSYL